MKERSRSPSKQPLALSLKKKRKKEIQTKKEVDETKRKQISYPRQEPQEGQELFWR